MTDTIPKEIMAASGAIMILAILKNGKNYGYEIIQKIKDATEGKTPWQEANIYPVLRKLDKKGLVKSSWDTDTFDRPRKYFVILEPGEKELKRKMEQWQTVNVIFEKLLNPAGE